MRLEEISDILASYSWAFKDLIGQPTEWTPRVNPRTVTATGNVNPLDDLLLCSGTSTLTLETAVGCGGRRHTFFKTDAGTTLTIACTGSETVGAATTYSTPKQYALIKVISNGTNWVIENPTAAGVVNAADFGFLPSATSAANKLALQAAIDSLGTTIGGEVVIPVGAYACDSGITVPQANTTISGTGLGSGYSRPEAGTTITFTATGGTIAIDMTAINGPGGAGNYSCLRNMSLKGNAVAGTGVKINGMAYLANMSFSGFTTHGIYLYNWINQTLLYNVASVENNGGIGLAIGDPVAETGGGNTVFQVNHCNFRQNRVGVKITNARHATFKNCVIESNTEEGLQLYQYTGGRVEFIEFDTCWFEENFAGGAAGYGIYMDSQTHDLVDGPADHIRFFNCAFVDTSPTDAIAIYSGKYIEFENCEIGGSQDILLDTWASYCTLKNCQYGSSGGVLTDNGTLNFTMNTDTTAGGGLRISRSVYASTLAATTNVSSATVSTGATYTGTVAATTNVSSASVSTLAVYATDVIGSTRISTATVSTAAVYSGTVAATTNVSSATLSTASVYATDVIGATRVSTATLSTASVYAPTLVSTAAISTNTLRALTNVSSATVSTGNIYSGGNTSTVSVSTGAVYTGTLAAATNVSSITLSTATVYGTDLIGATRVSTATVSSASVYAGTTVSTVTVATSSISFGQDALNYYDEGTWTPANPNVSLTVNSATFTRVGRKVSAQFDVEWPITADANNAQITGLPFTVLNNAGVAIMSTNRVTFISAQTVAGQTRLDLYANGVLSNANVATNRFIGTAVYFV